jgi:hypothetical protein
VADPICHIRAKFDFSFSGLPLVRNQAFLRLSPNHRQKEGVVVAKSELSAEINRLKAEFAGADENKLRALDALIRQAAYETVYLQRLNEQALASGLVEFHPENAKLQRTLPISGEIAKHSAALTNILDKLCRHLCVTQDAEDDILAEYE